MRPIPPALLEGPFTRDEATSHGVTSRMLQGRRFVRLHDGVWCVAGHPLTWDDAVAAARLALPDDAHPTGLTRIQQLGLDFGPRLPVRFVIARDHHVRLEGVFLHRTKHLPPTDNVGVTPAAAYLAFCRRARVVDAIKVGDWLLHHEHTTGTEIRDLALGQQWRAGADEALWVLEHLNARSRSLRESETSAILQFAGLPKPEVNAPLPVGEDLTILGDLVYKQWRTVVEYEGHQHQEDRGQYVADIDRYALIRAAGIQYVQVAHERLNQPKILVGSVYRTLIAGGYDGPAPLFDERWRQLFGTVSAAVGPRKDRTRHRAVG